MTFNSQAEVKFNLKTNVMNDTDQAMKELGKKGRKEGRMDGCEKGRRYY